MAINSFIFDTSKGESPQSIALQRALAAQILGQMGNKQARSPEEGIGNAFASIGQGIAANVWNRRANDAEKSGLSTVPQMFGGTGANPAADIAATITGQPSAPSVSTPMGSTSIPVTQADTGPTVPNDANAMPGTVGMNQRLADLTSDFLQDHPGTSISSGYRSNADQQRLYDNRASNPNPVAVPGTSRHERGLAVDIAGMSPLTRALLPQYGLSQPVPRDPPHVELAAATDAPSPLDTAQWPAGPSGAPGVQTAQAAPQSMSDGAELPANAQPAQGALPTAQAVQAASAPQRFMFPKASDDVLDKALANAFTPKEYRAAILKEKELRAEAAQKQSNPLYQAQVRKAQQDAGKSDWEWKPFGRDANGNWTYAWINSKTQAVKGRDGQPIDANPQPVDDPTAGLNGEDYLKAIPRDRADIARKVAAGEIDVSSLPNRGNYRMQVLSDAARFDPTFNPIDYKTRLATRKDFTSGKSAQNITSFNTAIGHLDSLDKSIDKLGNRGSSWWNATTAPITEQTDQHYQTALKEFRTSKQAVIDELTRAFRGSGGNVHDLLEWEKTINETESPAALHSATRQAIELLRSRIEAVGDQYNRGMGKKTDPVQLLSPKAQAAMARLEGIGGQTDAMHPPVDADALAEARRRGLIK